MKIPDAPRTDSVAVIGGGPAGLMAAETLMNHGVRVELYDAMPSVGRKFLLAGKGGMNITHAEAFDVFLTRYGPRQSEVGAWLRDFQPQQVQEWAHGLGINTFVGSSNRVFPVEMKAAPLLRAWLKRLKDGQVQFYMRHRWCGWHDSGALQFSTPSGMRLIQAQAILLALGGASWSRLGSDGAWVPWLQQHGVSIAPLQAANCGFDVGWSDHFQRRFSGHPLHSVAIIYQDATGASVRKQGQFVITQGGVEGSLIYAVSSMLRDQISAHGAALIHLDLAPDWSLQRVQDAVSHPRGSRSMASHLQSRLHINGVKAGLLHECLSKADFGDALRLSQTIKALPVRLVAARPIEEAISSAGGVRFDMLDQKMMLKAVPGVFCAGEMLDWEAPTGGYLLTACLASGRAAGLGMADWLSKINTARNTAHIRPGADFSRELQ